MAADNNFYIHTESCFFYSVDEAMKVNKTLMYINNHQNCDIKDYQNQLNALKEELVNVKVKLDAKPGDQDSVLFEKQQKILKLEQDNKLVCIVDCNYSNIYITYRGILYIIIIM